MGRNPETNLQLRIMVALSQTCVLFRIPAGMFWAGPNRDVPVKVAVKGHPDLAGYRRSDGRAVYIEVKTKKGRATPEQEQFLAVAKQAGCLAGVARSVGEARAIVEGEEEK